MKRCLLFLLCAPGLLVAMANPMIIASLERANARARAELQNARIKATLKIEDQEYTFSGPSTKDKPIQYVLPHESASIVYEVIAAGNRLQIDVQLFETPANVAPRCEKDFIANLSPGHETSVSVIIMGKAGRFAITVEADDSQTPQ